MNILITALDFKPKSGGMAEYAHQIACHLHLAGDNVTVLSEKTVETRDSKFDTCCPYTMRRFDFVKLKSHRIRRAYICYQAIKNAVRKHSIDIIINNSAGGLGLFCWLVSRLMGVPYCLFTHGFDVNARIPWTWRLKQMILLRGAERIFCNSSYTREIIISRGIRHCKTAIVHPGIPLHKIGMESSKHLPQIAEKQRLKQKKVLLTLGRIVERKGVDKVIECLPLVIKKIPNVVYIVVGDGPYRVTIEKMVCNLNLKEHVVFAGYVSDEDKPSYYSACDIFVMPNRELCNGNVEGFGIVFLEANSYGKPVIGGRSGGAIDAIEDGKSGLLVDPMNKTEIASAIVCLLEDENFAKRLGKMGRERVEKEFGWPVIVSKIRQELVEVVRNTS